MWTWVNNNKLINLSNVSHIECKPAADGGINVFARTPDALVTLCVCATEEEARVYMGKLRADLNRARK